MKLLMAMLVIVLAGCAHSTQVKAPPAKAAVATSIIFSAPPTEAYERCQRELKAAQAKIQEWKVYATKLENLLGTHEPPPADETDDAQP